MTADPSGGQASRIAYRSEPGVVDEHRLVDRGPEQMMISFHRPEEPPHGRVLICSPVGLPFERSHRREVVLGRALAATGVIVCRFHYRALGESSGHLSELSWETITEDAQWADDTLAVEAASLPQAIIGAHFGGAVALAIALEHPGAPVVLIDPVAAPRALVREMAIARRIAQPEATRGLAEEVEAVGFAEVCGWPLHQRFLESLDRVDDATLAGVGERPILVVSPESRGQVARPHAALAERLERAGATVDLRPVGDDPVWWLGSSRKTGPEEERPGTRALLDIVPPWIRSRVRTP